MFVSKLYSYQDIARLRTCDVVKDTSKLLQNIRNEIQESVLSLLDLKNRSNLEDKINDIFNSNLNILDNLNTEHKAFKTFKDLGTFIYPESVLLGYRYEYMNANNVKILQKVPVQAEFIPLRFVLKTFFELKDVFISTIEYMHYLYENKEIVTNFIQMSLWSDYRKDFVGELVLPLILFYDDYETNNPLGSHRGIAKCGAVYVTIPCLPPN